jgi:uncharacterized protein (TIGR01777 family)
MRILVSGSTGFLGTALVEKWARQGHTIARLVRPGTDRKSAAETQTQSVRWDPVSAEFDAAGAEGADALVHLAGASIAGGRWNPSRKSLLRTSRVDATRHLIGALAKLQRPPRVIVAASAVGYYGNRAEETLSETSAPGDDFLCGVCREWEAEARRGTAFGARVVNLRFGIILATHGGALPQMVTPFKFGVGGRLGDGRQWMSWLTLEETVGIVDFALQSSGLTGPVNAVTPNPVRNSEFTKVLAKALRRPALFPAPAFALRLALGEMADALLLVSQKVVPSKLVDSGYSFLQANLTEALANVLRKQTSEA